MYSQHIDTLQQHTTSTLLAATRADAPLSPALYRMLHVSTTCVNSARRPAVARNRDT